MTNKELNKVQNEVKKASEKTLTGAIKTWCQLFKSGKEINEILKENEIKVDKSILSLEKALGIDIYYIIDTQLIILFWRNFKIVFTYCILWD